jgi:inorganic pyrophosphatase
MSEEFWDILAELVADSQIIYDRLKGSTHPRYPEQIYPVDYGYLQGTGAIDGGGVDIWVGTSGKKTITGVLCTVDLIKKDTELKILFDCTQEEITSILKFVNTKKMRAIYLEKGR